MSSSPSLLSELEDLLREGTHAACAFRLRHTLRGGHCGLTKPKLYTRTNVSTN